MNNSLIQNIEEHGQYGNFPHSFTFHLGDTDDDGFDTEAEMGKWVCDNFEGYFVLSVCCWNIIAGGYADKKGNKKSYDYQIATRFNDDYEDRMCVDKYQLNCHEEDATMFALRWGHVLK